MLKYFPNKGDKLKKTHSFKNATQKFFTINTKQFINELVDVKEDFHLNLIDYNLNDENMEKLTEIIDWSIHITELSIRISQEITRRDILAQFFKKLSKKRHVAKIWIYLKGISKEQNEIFNKDFLSRLPENCAHLRLKVKCYSNKEMNDKMFTQMLNCLKYYPNKITTLDISDNRFYSQEPLLTLQDLLSQETCKIRSLIINGTIIYDPLHKSQLLCTIFDKCTNTHIEQFSAQNCALNYSSMKAAANVLQNMTKFTQINFSMSCMDKFSIKIFSNLLLGECLLEVLDLSYNYIGNEGCNIISHCLRTNPYLRLQKLKLKRNFIYDLGFEYLASGMKENDSIKSLNLQDNLISDEGVIKFTEILSHNESKFRCANLRKINLTWNKIRNEGIIAFGHFISHCPNFQKICIADNKINDKTAHRLFNILRTAKKINTDADSHMPALREIDIAFNELRADSMIFLNDVLQENPIEKLYLENNEIGDIGLDYISAGLASLNSLIVLRLSKCELRDAGVVLLSQRLMNSTTLEELDLNDNKISTLGCQKIAEVVMIKPSLLILHMGHNLIEPKGAKLIGDGLLISKGLRHLLLNSNKIQDEGCGYISAGLRGNTYLEELNLENNELSDQGIKFLADGLIPANTNLTKLNLASNNFTDVLSLCKLIAHVPLVNFSSNRINDQGFALTIEAMATNPCLKRLRLSNSNVGVAKGAGNEGGKGMKMISKALAHARNIKRLDFGFSSFEGEHLSHLFDLNNLNSVTMIDLRSNLIHDEGAKAISRFLSCKNENLTLKKLFLQSNRITVNGIEELSNALKVNKSLKELNLADNNIFSQGMILLSNAMKINSTLEILMVNYTKLNAYCANDIATMLKINQSLKSLSLYGNNLTNRGVDTVMRSLMFNKTLKHLAIGNNHCDDKGLDNLFKYLKMNKTIVYLELNTGNLTRKTANKLSKFLNWSKSLASVNLVNNLIDSEGIHKLILGIERHHEVQEIKMLLNPIDNDQKKIILSSCEHILFN